MYHELGDERGVAIVLSNLGYRLVIQGAYEEAKFLCDEALSLFRKLDERASMPLPLINLGLAALMQDRPEEALAYFREGLQLGHELGFVVPIVYSLDGLAAALAGIGSLEQAATVLGAAEAPPSRQVSHSSRSNRRFTTGPSTRWSGSVPRAPPDGSCRSTRPSPGRSARSARTSPPSLAPSLAPSKAAGTTP